jgi:hypothetical protein
MRARTAGPRHACHPLCPDAARSQVYTCNGDPRKLDNVDKLDKLVTFRTTNEERSDERTTNRIPMRQDPKGLKEAFGVS